MIGRSALAHFQPQRVVKRGEELSL
jgi:hypothetical protein